MTGWGRGNDRMGAREWQDGGAGMMGRMGRGMVPPLKRGARGVLRRGRRLWIPAYAGMTIWAAGRWG